MDNVTLIGMPGSGKSTVGVLLAKLLGYQFLDVDLLIQEREGALLQEILDRRGTAAFLDAEEAALHLKGLGPVVYLQVPLEELTRRIHNLSTRGIAMEPGQTLADVMAFREPLYSKYADLVIPCPPGQELAETAKIILERLQAGK